MYKILCIKAYKYFKCYTEKNGLIGLVTLVENGQIRIFWLNLLEF